MMRRMFSYRHIVGVFWKLILVFLVVRSRSSGGSSIGSSGSSSISSNSYTSSSVDPNSGPTTEDVSLLLHLARENVKQESSKAAHYYSEIIGSLSGSIEVDDHAFDGPFPEDPRYQHLSSALYELSDMLEKAGCRSRNESAVHESFDYLFRAAAMGNTDAQHRLSAAYATGIYGGALVPVDAGRSLVLEYMAALGGNPEACMGMGYRYLHGIGVPESCEKAQIYYEYAANEAAEQIRLLGMGGAHPKFSERLKLSDVEVAVAKGRRDVDPEVIDYYKHLSAGGDSSAANSLGSMYLQGSRFVDQDVDRAIHYFRMAADVGHVSASAQLGYLLVQRLSLKLQRQRNMDEKKKKLLAAGGVPAGDESPPVLQGDQHDESRTSTKTPSPEAMDSPATQPKTATATKPDPKTISKSHLNALLRESPRNETDLAMEVEKIVRLFRYAANRGDALANVGLGFLHFTGLADVVDTSNVSVAMLGQLYGPGGKDKRGMAKAYDLFFKVSAKHMDAGFFMGEILMGRDQIHGDLKQLYKSSALPSSGEGEGREAGADGESKGKEQAAGSGVHATHAAATGASTSNVQGSPTVQSTPGAAAGTITTGQQLKAPPPLPPLPPHQQQTPRVVAVDPAAAAQSYAVASQRGNMLALHRLAHLSALGIGTTRSCPSATNGFKNVAERGHWGHELTEAHRLADAGERAAALTLFSRKAAIGVETAQFNTGYLLMKDPELMWMKPPPSAVRMAAALEKKATAAAQELQASSLSDADAAPPPQATATVSETGDVVVDTAAPSDGSHAVGAANSVISALYSTEARHWWWLSESSMAKDHTAGGDAASLVNGSDSDSAGIVEGALIDKMREACEARSLVLFALSASQGNAESYLKVGDFYYYGSAGLERNKFEAAVFYQMAADLRNTHAIFNLGIMHEAGDGVQQDFHLAKRFYDQAAEFDADARTPRALALFLLNSHRSLQDAVGAEATARLADMLIDAATQFELARQHGFRWLSLPGAKWLMQRFAGDDAHLYDTSGGSRASRFSASSGSGKPTGRRPMQWQRGNGQWRDLEGIIFDAVKHFVKTGSGFGIKRELLSIAALWTAFIFIGRWRHARRG